MLMMKWWSEDEERAVASSYVAHGRRARARISRGGQSRGRVGGVAQCEPGVVGSGRAGRGRWGRGCGGSRWHPLRAVRPPVQQRVQSAPARAANPWGATRGVHHVWPQLQDAAVSAPPHAGAAPSARPQAATATAPRTAARAALPTVAAAGDRRPTRSLLLTRINILGPDAIFLYCRSV